MIVFETTHYEVIRYANVKAFHLLAFIVLAYGDRYRKCSSYGIYLAIVTTDATLHLNIFM